VRFSSRLSVLHQSPVLHANLNWFRYGDPDEGILHRHPRFVAAVGLLALVVYPYGVGESTVLAEAFVLVVFYRTVLDDAF